MIHFRPQPRAVQFCFAKAIVWSLVAHFAMAQAVGERPTAVPNDPVAKTFQTDATLRGIAAIGRDHLVAVGDRGTILVSADAGHSWKLIPAPTSINLYDVQFVGDVGFAVGGWIGSSTGTSYGAILRTNDAGETWQLVKSDPLPRLIGVRLVGNKLICWGDYSNSLGGGVFESLTEGVQWKAAIDDCGAASAAAASAAGEVLAVDQLGRAKLSGSRVVQNVGYPNWQLKAAISLGNRWLLAGENGELIRSADGQQWTNVALPLSTAARAYCQWNCLAEKDGKIWLAGSPGAVVMRSVDNGATWQSSATGWNLPLHDICFIDENFGWAVGSAGAVLATRDGGATWYVQRQIATRVAMLTVAPDAGSVPWLPAVATVWDSHRATAAVVLEHAEPIECAEPTPTCDVAAANVATQIGMLDLQVCDSDRDDESIALRRLAAQIAMWRPDVVLCAKRSSDSLRENAPDRSVAKAIQLLSDPTFAAELQEIGLERWSIAKLVAVVESGQGEFSEDPQRVLRQSGQAIQDILECTPKQCSRSSGQISMRNMWCRSMSRAAGAELLGGIALTAESMLSSESRPLGSYQQVMGRVHRDRALQQLISAESAASNDEQWQSQLRFYFASVPARELASAMMQLCDGLVNSGQYRRSLAVLWQLSASQDDLGLWAAQRYLQLTSSAETQHWLSASAIKALEPQSATVQTAAYQDTWSNSPFDENSSQRAPSASARAALAAPNTPDAQTSVTSAAHISVDQPITVDDWNLAAESLFKMQPRLRSLPNVQMLLVKQMRPQRTDGARLLLMELMQRSQLIGWSQAAKQELALLDGTAETLKWQTAVMPTSHVPKLDGNLDEPWWQSAGAMKLTQLDGAGTGTRVLWSYDSDYLYLGVQCPRSSQQLRQPPVKARSHDDLRSDIDHVEIMIDIDRDYSSTIELAIGENGQTFDRCLGLSGFNPRWYVDVSSSANVWQAEVAIRLDSLTASSVTSGATWAVSARRCVPNAAPESWSQLKSHNRYAEAAGLLQFK